MICTGNGADHCCIVNGEVCAFLEEHTVPGRRWVCGLLRELGSWAAVHADPRYRPVQAVWDACDNIESCGAWGPNSGQCCYVEAS